MAYVNLWECITSLAETDKTGADKCQEMQNAAAVSSGFGTELGLDIKDGIWTITLFNHDPMDSDRVELRIDHLGGIQVSRIRTGHHICDKRTLMF